MSPRAAWRLESLGFSDLYDYVAGKADWGAAGYPFEGAVGPRARDVARSDVPTCSRDERLRDVQARVRDAGWDTCIVVSDENIVLGRLGREALAADEDARVEDVMAEGPSTIRPDMPLEKIVRRLEERGLRTAVVTTSDGRLVGILRLEDAERRLVS